ncbi:MAG: hypothetical protein ACK5JT_20755 [Hyphomicrobiaceae bacterium]
MFREKIDPCRFPVHDCVRQRVRGLLRALALGVCGTVLLAALVIGGYLIKSAAGINLFPGHSPLHTYFYPLVANS